MKRMTTWPAVGLIAGLALGACGGATEEPAEPTPAESAAGDEVAETRDAPAEQAVEADPRLAALLGAPDRLEADHALDEGRRPAEVLTFFGIGEGQRVADLFAGTGYTTELLARAVGPEGHVYAQNNAFVMDRFARGPLEARLARDGLAHVEVVEREMDAPLPEGARDLDAVIFILAYHDTFWMEADRAAMNRAIFEALRPGGVYGIVDHAAAAGSGARDVQSLHRVDEALVVEEVLAAGFELEARADTLRRADDPRDWNAAPSAAGERRGTSDRFTLRFVRPR